MDPRVGDGGADWECRPAIGADATGIAEAMVAAWRAGYAGLMPADFLRALDAERIAERWRSAPASARAFRQLLASQGLVIAAASGGPASDGAQLGRAELYSINVRPEHWGCGAGRLLLRASEGRLLDAGFSRAILWVVTANVRARRFYEVAGWRPNGEERTTSELTGSPLHEICLERELGFNAEAPGQSASSAR